MSIMMKIYIFQDVNYQASAVPDFAGETIEIVLENWKIIKVSIESARNMNSCVALISIKSTFSYSCNFHQIDFLSQKRGKILTANVINSILLGFVNWIRGNFWNGIHRQRGILHVEVVFEEFLSFASSKNGFASIFAFADLLVVSLCACWKPQTVFCWLFNASTNIVECPTWVW